MSLFFCEVLSLIIIHPACLPSLSLWLPLAVIVTAMLINYLNTVQLDTVVATIIAASAAASLPDDITIASK